MSLNHIIALVILPVWILKVRAPLVVGWITPLKRNFDNTLLFTESTMNSSGEALSSFIFKESARLSIAMLPGFNAEPVNM
jgi:hypothetical protein